jgi:hypothetical protein
MIVYWGVRGSNRSGQAVHTSIDIIFYDIAPPMLETPINYPVSPLRHTTGQRPWSRIPAPTTEVKAVGQQLENPEGWPITRTA